MGVVMAVRSVILGAMVGGEVTEITSIEAR